VTLSEGGVILFGLFAGYWVVSKLFFRPPPAKDQSKPASNAPAAGAEPGWHEILGVSSEATADEIREAYRHLISNYHPDKVDAAYREAMRSRGVDP
jgi:hypothetical protein